VSRKEKTLKGRQGFSRGVDNSLIKDSSLARPECVGHVICVRKLEVWKTIGSIWFSHVLC